MHRRFLDQPETQKGAQAQAVGAAPGNAALAVQPLEVADEEHAEITPRRDARPSALLVMRRAQALDILVKARLGQHHVEFAVEGMTGAGDHLGRGDKHVVLFGRSSSNCHAYLTLRRPNCSVNYTTFFNGLLTWSAFLNQGAPEFGLALDQNNHAV